MHQRRVIFQRLHEVWLQCIAQQRSHRALRPQRSRLNGLLIAGGADGDVTDAFAQIRQIGRQAKTRHDFRGDRDVEAGLAHDAVVIAAETGRNRTQGAVIHIENAPPGHPPRIDVELVLPMHVVIDHGRKKVVRRPDGVKITSEVQVDVGHWHDLRVTTTRGAALHAKAGAKARLAQAHHRLLADPVEAVAETDRRRGLALASRRWRNRGDQNQFAVRLVLQSRQEIVADFCLVVAVGNDVRGGNAKIRGNLRDRQLARRLCNINV